MKGYENLQVNAEIGHAITNVKYTDFQRLDGLEIKGGQSERVEFNIVLNPNQFKISSTVSPTYRVTHYFDLVINEDDHNVFTKYLTTPRIPVLICAGDDVDFIEVISGRKEYDPDDFPQYFKKGHGSN